MWRETPRVGANTWHTHRAGPVPASPGVGNNNVAHQDSRAAIFTTLINPLMIMKAIEINSALFKGSLHDGDQTFIIAMYKMSLKITTCCSLLLSYLIHLQLVLLIKHHKHQSLHLRHKRIQIIFSKPLQFKKINKTAERAAASLIKMATLERQKADTIIVCYFFFSQAVNINKL